MKKTYQIPTITTTAISTGTIIAASPAGYNNAIGSAVNGDAALVKEQQRNDYDVWSDDWSK